MSRYAEKTTVSSSRSRAEIEDTLMRYGATGFLSGQAPDKAIIAFEAKGRRIKFVLPLLMPIATVRCGASHLDGVLVAVFWTAAATWVLVRAFS